MSADQLEVYQAAACKAKLEAAVCDTEQATEKQSVVQSCFDELIVAEGVQGVASFKSWQQDMRAATAYA